MSRKSAETVCISTPGAKPSWGNAVGVQKDVKELDLHRRIIVATVCDNMYIPTRRWCNTKSPACHRTTFSLIPEPPSVGNKLYVHQVPECEASIAAILRIRFCSSDVGGGSSNSSGMKRRRNGPTLFIITFLWTRTKQPDEYRDKRKKCPGIDQYQFSWTLFVRFNVPCLTKQHLYSLLARMRYNFVIPTDAAVPKIIHFVYRFFLFDLLFQTNLQIDRAV